MSKTLLIVESPSKAKTIKKYLGPKTYNVIASVGHVVDLPKSKLGIDIAHNFEPQYIQIRGKGDVIKSLRKEAKEADRVLLATDPDREGEAIAWHLSKLLKLDGNSACRIQFNEITKDAVKAAVKAPRAIDMKRVDAQQARRVTDRLVGYQISPLLWKKICPGLSAGRVQSAALKLICDRDKEIDAFVPEEYWTITAVLKQAEGKHKAFSAKLEKRKGRKLELHTEAEAQAVLDALRPDAYEVRSVTEKEVKKAPFAPFTTSSLQQAASVRLGFNPSKTMLLAQQLYEGIEIKGHGTLGLVTYIRTDSVRISEEADRAVRAYIKEEYGEHYLGRGVFSNRSRAVQDGHEAIRPSDLHLTPDEIKDSLSRDQYKLYHLIWTRFVASRMSAAVYDSVSAEIVNGDYGFKAGGSKQRFDGYRRVYLVSDDEEEKQNLQLREGETLTQEELKPEQKFTAPPAHFTDASLVKELEDRGIGRPSTYAAIIATLLKRQYVSRNKKSLLRTDLGQVVDDVMEAYFPDIVNTEYTARVEERLDQVESEGIAWQDVVADFYQPLRAELEKAGQEMGKVDLPQRVSEELCPECGAPMVYKKGRFGEFLACSRYPDCKGTMSIQTKIGVDCPKCGKPLVRRKGKKGKIFYGCSGYPDCKEVFWDEPTAERCPNCGSLLCKSGRGGLSCSNKECGYKKR